MSVSIGKQAADGISTCLCVGFKRTIFSFIVVESCSKVSIPSVKFLFFAQMNVLCSRTSDDKKFFVPLSCKFYCCTVYIRECLNVSLYFECIIY